MSTNLTNVKLKLFKIIVLCSVIYILLIFKSSPGDNSTGQFIVVLTHHVLYGYGSCNNFF